MAEKRATRTSKATKDVASNGLNFGTHSGIQDFSLSEESYARPELVGGASNCVLTAVSEEDNTNDKGEVISHKIKLNFEGEDGKGGCVDVISTQSPSFWRKSMRRIKYLLLANDIEIPASFKTPIIEANALTKNDAFLASQAGFEAYTEAHGADAFLEMFTKGEDGVIIAKRQDVYTQYFVDTDIQMIYVDPSLIEDAQDERDSAHYELRTSDEYKAMDASSQKQAKKDITDAYNDKLNAMPIVLCLCNMELFDDMLEALNEIPKDNIFHVTALKKDFTRAGKYAVAK